MKTIVLTYRAAKELDAVAQPARQAIGEVLNTYAVTGQGDVTKRSGRDGYRMRVGNSRILFAQDATTILAVYVGRRCATTYGGATEMLELNPQFIKTEAGDLVVLTRAEYDAIIGRLNSDEDAEEMAIFDVRMAELASGSDSRLPAHVAASMLKGDTLLRALRKWKGVTQSQVALKTGLAQGYISDIESGRKPGTPEVVRKIADAIEIDPQWLQPSP